MAKVQGTETVYDSQGDVLVVNDTDVDDSAVMAALEEGYPAIASAFNSWSSPKRTGGIFSRDRYVTPANIFDQFRTAKDASSSDDVVSGVVEGTEALAFNGIKIDCPDPTQEDMWNQIIEDIDLEARAREMWREAFIISQFYGAVAWHDKTFKAQSKTKGGNKRRTETKLKVPIGISLLDPLTVLPVGSFLFNREQLAFIANPSESADWDNMLANKNTTMQDKSLVDGQMIVGRYAPTESEKQLLAQLLGNSHARTASENMWLMDEENTFRWTATRPSYQRFADCRMKSVFELLDLKHLLREMDRAHLLGGTNFIVLVKKGSDAQPAKPAEITNLTALVRNASRLPIMIGDHRLSVEIITPDLDQTLDPTRYNGLDARITARLYQIFMTGNFAAGAKGDDSIKLARVIARGMESRRRAVGRAIMQNVIKPTKEANADFFTERATLRFSPRKVALDFDPALATYIENLRMRGEISREAVLDLVDYDQAEEVEKRKSEKSNGWDRVMAPPEVLPAGQAGQLLGGNKGGGGKNQESTKPNPVPRGPDGPNVDGDPKTKDPNKKK